MAKLKTGRHTSSLKEVRKAKRRRWANQVAKTRARGLARELLSAIRSKDADKVKELLPQTVSAWHRLANRGRVHPSNASRKIGRMSAAARRALTPA